MPETAKHSFCFANPHLLHSVTNRHNNMQDTEISTNLLLSGDCDGDEDRDGEVWSCLISFLRFSFLRLSTTSTVVWLQNKQWWFKHPVNSKVRVLAMHKHRLWQWGRQLEERISNTSWDMSTSRPSPLAKQQPLPPRFDEDRLHFALQAWKNVGMTMRQNDLALQCLRLQNTHFALLEQTHTCYIQSQDMEISTNLLFSGDCDSDKDKNREVWSCLWTRFLGRPQLP